MITRTDVLASLEAKAKVGFFSARNAYVPKRAAFTRETPSDGAFEVYADLGASPWPIQNGGQTGGSTDGRTSSAQVGGLGAGGAATILGTNEKSLVVYNRPWEIAIGITHDAINDNRVGGLADWAMGAGSSFEQHKDFVCFDALNAGEATTSYGAGPDKLSFFNDSHIAPGAQYQTAQDNKYALTLSMANFETVRVAGAKFLNERGIPSANNHTLLIHATDLERTAAQITDNKEDNSTANRASNPYAGLITRLSAPGTWFDSTAWVVLDVSSPIKPINLQVREAAAFHSWDDYTQMGGVRYFMLRARYEAFYGDWRLGIMGNT